MPYGFGNEDGLQVQSHQQDTAIGQFGVTVLSIIPAILPLSINLWPSFTWESLGNLFSTETI